MSIDFTALDEQFNDLPLLSPIPSVMYPDFDGDMAELHELADRVFCYPAREVARLPHRYIYHLIQDHTGTFPAQLLNPFEWDKAAKLLREWRRG